MARPRDIDSTLTRAVEKATSIRSCGERPGGHRWGEPIRVVYEDARRNRAGETIRPEVLGWERKCLDCGVLSGRRRTKADLAAHMREIRRGR